MLNGIRILFLTTVLPRKKRMGSEVASQSVIDALIELGAQVTVVGYVRRHEYYELGPHDVCVSRRPIETKGAKLQPLLWFGSALWRRMPYSVAKYRSTSFTSKVTALVQAEKFDLVIIDHVQMSWLVDSIPTECKLIGLTHNIEHKMYQSFIGKRESHLRQWIYGRESRLLLDMETDFAEKLDQLWVLTRSDAEFYASMSQDAEIREIPLPASTIPSELTPIDKHFDVGLIGSWTWSPNEEGLRWFFAEVYPNLPAMLDIRVAGHGAKWLKGRYANVKYLDFVADAQNFLRQARVVAIPTLSGGGIQIKTLDAIASGSQIVATQLASRGIHDLPPNMAVAQDPREFSTLLLTAIAESNTNSVAALAIEWSQLRHNHFRKEVEQNIRDAIAPNE